MKTISYFGLSDMAASHYVDLCEEILTSLSETTELVDVNEAITLFNVLRYADAGLKKRWAESLIAQARKLVGVFGSTVDSTRLSKLYNSVESQYVYDFWHLFSSYRWYRKVPASSFEAFLASEKPAIRPILAQKSLMHEYADELKTYFLSNPENATIFIGSKNKKTSPIGSDNVYIPEGISAKSLELLLDRYVDLPDCSYGYLVIIENMHEASDKTKLRARRKAKDLSTTMFSHSKGFTIGVEICYVEQSSSVKIEHDNGIVKYSYDIGWVTNELGPPTILNNFIYLFEFVDLQGRINLVAIESEISVVERMLNTERTDWYSGGVVFAQKNQAALMQLYSYSKILESKNIRIESIINWFFSDYLKENHGISDFLVSLPSDSMSYPEKCRVLAPEIERAIKQYLLYCQDGMIDQELLAIASNPIPIADCRSRVNKKYAYAKSDDILRAIYYFFSDQCMLSYDDSTKVSEKNFYSRIAKGPVRRDRIGNYLSNDVAWLLEKGYLEQSVEGFLSAKNHLRILLLRELYHNQVIVYWTCPVDLRTIIDEMVASGDLSLETSLFSASEKDYLNYHLNKKRFINSLDLRNRYAHGCNPNSSTDEKSFINDYLQLLKIMVLIVLKINDDLEQSETERTTGAHPVI